PRRVLACPTESAPPVPRQRRREPLPFSESGLSAAHVIFKPARTQLDFRRPCHAVPVGLRVARKRADSNSAENSSRSALQAVKVTSADPSPSNRTPQTSPGLRNLRPVQDPQVTNCPARTPPFSRHRLTRTTAMPSGSPVGWPPSCWSSVLPFTVKITCKRPSSSPCQSFFGSP